MNIRWDVVAWNQSACAVFGDYSVLPLQDRNTIWRAFTSSYIKQLVDDWESHARKKAAQFRAGYARQCGDPWWDAMLERLSQGSEDFRRIWADHAVLDSPEGAKLLHHPLIDALYLEHLSFHLCDSPDLIMTVYLPKEQRTAEKLEHLSIFL